MNRAGFTWAKLTGQTDRIAALSLALGPILALAEGKKVALVGNARSLAAGTHGAAIDDADLIIRINTAPIPSMGSHGSRTDWLAMSIPVSQALITARAPSQLLWMASKLKRLPWRIANDARFFLNPATSVANLRDQLAAPATTGLMCIDLLARSNAQSVSLYGFDFFASLSLTGRRSANDVPHDFAAERGFVEHLLISDRRFSLNL